MGGVFLTMSGSAMGADKTVTVTLNQSAPQVVFATMRAGDSANQNLPTTLITRGADNADDRQRALLKFDTQNTIPEGATVTSAMLTVTLKRASAVESRHIGVYQITTSWDEDEVTWNRRRTSAAWATPGGDLGSRLAEHNVGNDAGVKITYDITALVKQAVGGDLGTSRYTRVALVDLNGAEIDTTREFYTPADSDPARRPTLKVVYSDGKGKPKPPPPPTSATLRMLQWNTHHGGVGTDGELDADRLIKKAASFKPDVVSLNEVERFTSWGNYDGPAVMASLLKKHTGKTWYWKFATATGDSTGNGNVVLSRFPIDAASVRLLSNDRVAVNIVVNVNGRAVNITSTHLDADSTSRRLQQIGELKAWQKTLAEPRIVAGDFNAWDGSSEHAEMIETYVDSWEQAEKDGTAVSYPGNENGNTRNSRIDYVYASKGATVLALESSQVFDVRDSKGVMPSDHRPVLSIFTVK